ncbi:MAG: hypothetical protein Q9212_003693 [Teloschistes hypoglaucus]
MTSTQPRTASTRWDDASSDSAFAIDSTGLQSTSSSGFRRRKPPGSITHNACTNCKKARAKCDGNKPACYRCTARQHSTSCRYEIHSKAVKEQLLSEIHRLREENHQLEHQNLHLGLSNDSLEEILRSLKDDQKGQEILQLLKLGKDHQYITAWLSRPHCSLDLQGSHVSSASLLPHDETVGSNQQQSVMDRQAQWSWADINNVYNVLFASEQPTSSGPVYPAVELPISLEPHRKPRPLITPTPTVPSRRYKGPLLFGSVWFGAVSWYGYSLYSTIATANDVAPQDFDFSHRFDSTATGFDQEVDSTEWLMGVTKMRRRIVEKAHGNVLEAAVGTGRNSDFYDLSRIKSLTLLDQSQEMLEVARAKWKKAHGEDKQCRLLPWSAVDPVPPSPADSNDAGVEGYDTIIATLSLCSVIGPSLFLRNLAGHLAPQHSTRPVTSNTSPGPTAPPPARIYLLEHGRSYYPWLNKILDRTASAHASKHGCWWNRDIGKIAEDSGLEIINLQRRHFGTTWSLELGLPERARGQDRQQWLEENRRKMITMRAEVERQRKEGEEFVRKQEEARQEEGALERWRTEQREQMREKD